MPKIFFNLSEIGFQSIVFFELSHHFIEFWMLIKRTLVISTCSEFAHQVKSAESNTCRSKPTKSRRLTMASIPCASSTRGRTALENWSSPLPWITYEKNKPDRMRSLVTPLAAWDTFDTPVLTRPPQAAGTNASETRNSPKNHHSSAQKTSDKIPESWRRLSSRCRCPRQISKFAFKILPTGNTRSNFPAWLIVSTHGRICL